MNNYNLNRFIKEQQIAYPTALAEIKDGRKRSHWMWYIFPQVKGLGYSSTAQYYGLDGIEEAKAYLENDYLRGNLLEICQALLQLDSNDAEAIFGYPDVLKLRSSMTIFDLAVQDVFVFRQVLDKFFDGEQDKRTIEIVSKL